MPKSTSSTDRVSESLAAIAKAADVLFKHTTKAVSIRESTTRTTVMGPVLDQTRYPQKTR